MDDFDWLAEKENPSSLPMPVRPKNPRMKRPKALIEAERKLTPAMRMYLRFLIESPTVKVAEKKMDDAGFTFDRGTYWRWRRRPDFIQAQELGIEYVAKSIGISKARTLLDAEKVKELALEEQPIMRKGEIVGYSAELGTAMRAIEFQGKALGIGNEERQRVQVSIDIDFSGRDERATTIEGEVLEN